MSYLALTLLGISVLVLWIIYGFFKEKRDLAWALIGTLFFCLCVYNGIIDEHNYKVISAINKNYYCVVNEDGKTNVIPNNDISIGIGDSFTMNECEFNRKYPNVDVTNIEIN